MEEKKLVTILVPAYNEQEVLHMLYDRLKKLMDENTKYDFEILLINDGSKDKTLEIMRELREKDKRVCYLNLSRNFGKETAMIAGLDYCNGDAVVIIDADLQDPPELIPEMLKYWEEGYDDVYAKRRSRKGESFLKKFTSTMYYKVLQAFTKIQIQKDTGDFRLLDRRCVEALKSIRESQRYTKGLFSWIGYNKKEILYDRDPRAAGQTKWNYRNLVNLSIDGITSFTTSPLRWSAILGILVSLAGFIYMLVIIIKTLVNGVEVPGYASTMVVILFLGGIQLIFLGVIGEYLGRAFYETKGRPLYFIERYNEGFKDLNISVLDHYGGDHSSSGHLYLTRIPGRTREECNEVIDKMAEAGIATNVHYKPLPMMTAYKNLGFHIENYQNAYHMFENEITLPLHTCLTDEEIGYVIHTYRRIVKEL